MIAVKSQPLARGDKVAAWAALAQPLARLSVQERERALESAQLVELTPGRTLFAEDFGHDALWYLFDGAVALRFQHGRMERLAAGADGAGHPLNPMPADCLGITTLETTLLIRVEEASLRQASPAFAAPAESAPSEEDGEEDRDWMSVLLESELFHRLPLRFLPQVFARLEAVFVDAGDVVVSQDDLGDYYYIVREGRCQVLRRPPKGAQPVPLAELGVGACFGEEALIGGFPRNASVVMLTKGIVMRLAKEDFQELIQMPLVRTVTRAEAERLAAGGAVWVDVRFPEEFEKDGLPGALNIPLNLMRMRAGRLERATPYVTYCDTGRRAAIGAFLLAERGFDVYCLSTLQEATASAEAAIAEHLVSGGANSSQTQSLTLTRDPGQIRAELNEELAGLRSALGRAAPLDEFIDAALASLQSLTAGESTERHERAIETLRHARAGVERALNDLQTALYGVPVAEPPTG